MGTRARTLRKTLVASAAALALSATAAWADGANLTLPAQPLAQSLKQIARATGTNILFTPDAVEGLTARAITGQMTARQAVTTLINGTNLQVIADDSGGLIVTRKMSTTRRVEAAPVKPVGEARIAQAAEPPQQTQDEGEAPSEDNVEKVTVTGTRIRGASPASPVITITRKDIERSGATDTAQIAQRLPQNFFGDVTPGIEVSPTTGDSVNFTDGASFNLRGLGAGNTLTLINGVRAAPSGHGDFIDVSLIPVSLINRIEILPDGASSIYGSDAIAGVVNVILRRDFDGVEAAARAGTVTRGSHEEYVGSLAAGTLWTGGGAYIGGEYLNRTDLDASDRDVTRDLPGPRPLINPEERTSLVAGIHQEIAGFDVSADFIWGDKHGLRYPIFFSFGLFGFSETTDDSRMFIGSVERDLGGDWRMRLSGSLGSMDSTAIEDFPDLPDFSSLYEIASNARGLTGVVDGTLFDGWAGPIRTAVGASFSYVDYHVQVSDLFGPFFDRQGDRESYAFFGEAQIPLLRGSDVDAPSMLEASVSLRHETYDAFGDTTNPRIGLIFRPFDGLALRSTWGTSFKVPDFRELAERRITTLDFVPDPQSTNAFGRTAALVLTGTDPDVQPETADTFTVGFDAVFDLAKGVKLSGTYYEIDFVDRIDTPAAGYLNLLPNPGAYSDFILRSPGAGDIAEALAWGILQDRSRFAPGGPVTIADVAVILDNRTQNIASTEVRGFDLGVDSSFEVGEGTLSLYANLAYLMTYKDHATPTAQAVNGVDIYLRPADIRVGLGGAFDWGRNTFDASILYIDDFKDTRTLPTVTIDSFTTLNVGYTRVLAAGDNGDPATTLRLYIDNVFDDEPSAIQNQFEPGLNYDPTKGSPRGRFISLSLRQVW